MAEPKYVSTLNNQGVALFHSGDCGNAIKSFAAALRLSRKILSKTVSERTFLPYVNSSGLMMDKLQEDHEYEPWINKHCFVYDRPILMEGTQLPTSMESFVTRISSIIFNLALAHHLQAASTQEHSKRSILLQKAAEFYKQALKLRQDGTHWEYFTVVCWNNLGGVFQGLGQEEKSAMCFQELLGALARVSPAFSGARSIEENETIYRVFRQNVLLHLVKGCTTMAKVAPAA